MKKFKPTVATLAISISTISSLSSNRTEPTSGDFAKKALRAKIVKLLGKHPYDLKTDVLKADVSIMLNNKNELVVVSVESNNDQLDNFVTGKLNYKKVMIKGIAPGTIYKVPVKIK